MLHLHIISAHDLSAKNITSYVEVVPKIEGAPRENFMAYAVTKKVSKDSDPQYNEDILIPFYCFNSIQLIFNEKKMVGERSIARITIPLNLGTLLKPQPITDRIELYNSFKGANATVTYSVSYTPLTNIITQKFQNPIKVYTYLTYNPPLQLNFQEVRMFCRGIENKGTIYDPSTREHIQIEEEPTKCGPSGLTQVFYFDHSYVQDGNFFFYIKAMNYTGKVTLNFATAPEYIEKDSSHQYFCNDTDSSIVVNCNNGTQNTFALFPVSLLMTLSKVSVKPISVTESDGIHNTPVYPMQAGIQGKDDIENMKDYYTNHPEGIAQQKIFNAAVKAIHGSLPASPNNGSNAIMSFDIVPGKSYSLKSAFKANSINDMPKKISVSLSWSSCVDPTFCVYTCSEGCEKMSPIIFYDRHDKNNQVYFDYYDQFSKIRERIFFCLDKIDPAMKYVSLCALATMKPKRKGSNLIVRKNWSDAICIINDAESKAELMRFSLPTHDSPCGVFIALFIRGSDDNWMFMPVCKVFESKNPYASSPLTCVDSQEVFRDFVLSGAANK